MSNEPLRYDSARSFVQARLRHQVVGSGSIQPTSRRCQTSADRIRYANPPITGGCDDALSVSCGVDDAYYYYQL